MKKLELFDLSTREGRMRASKYLAPIAAVSMPWGPVLAILAASANTFASRANAKKANGIASHEQCSPSFFAQTNASTKAANKETRIEEQTALAMAIIKAGREDGLSEVEITLERDVGINLRAKLPKKLNVEISLDAGKSTTTTIRAKFHD